jgi:hypothetical protein
MQLDPTGRAALPGKVEKLGQLGGHSESSYDSYGKMMGK